MGCGWRYRRWLHPLHTLRRFEGKTQGGSRPQIRDSVSDLCQAGGSPFIHPHTALIKGVVCGVLIKEVQDPLMQKIRYLDKLIDELAKGKAMEKILR